MNEVVKRLMDEAQIIDPQNSGVMHISRENFQKYTGLIVKECMAMCEHQSGDDEYDHYDMGMSVKAENIKYKIKKHFGVVE